MNAPPPERESTTPLGTDLTLARRVRAKRVVARLVLFIERLLPLFLPVLGFAALFVSFAWLGLYRIFPDWLRLTTAFILTFGFLASLLPFAKLRWPRADEADRLLEERNHLPHQPVTAQDDVPAFETAFARALWSEHQRRMAETIASLDAGTPRPDIARHDKFALRTIPALLLVTAFAYSGSNGAGTIADAFRWSTSGAAAPDLRVDAWITPPAYTGRAPVFLTRRDSGEDGGAPPKVSVPQHSRMTIRVSGGSGEERVLFQPVEEMEAVPLGAAKADSSADRPASEAVQTTGQTYEAELAQSGVLAVGPNRWTIDVTPDVPPQIAFDGTPRRSVNGALEITFKGHDDYGLVEAHAEIEPTVVEPDATPLYPTPEYKLDLPRRSPRDPKGTSSRNLTEHPLAGQKVKITLVARDGAGQAGRSAPFEMTLPSREFAQPLAAAVAEERQVFALDTRDLPKAIALNEALTIRADETIPNLTHFLLIQSAQARMKLARTSEDLKGTADYLWEIALGIDDGDLSLAERKLREAQQALQDGLERNAPDDEIKKLMDDLRAAMQDFMKAMADRQPNAGSENRQQSAQNVLRQRDLENMLDQIENLARSGNRDAARDMLSQLQRMMNNLQTARPQQGNQQQNSQVQQQIDKLGELMQEQQKLMEETFKLDQALKDRMQRGDPGDGEDGELTQEPQQQPGGQPSPTDDITAEQLREALKNLRAQQDALGRKLGDLQKGLSDLGVKPGEGFAQAEREMRGAGEALGQGQGERAVEGQGKALEALRQGARDMMGQMMQAMRNQGQGQGTQQGDQTGRDPLGRPRPTDGPEFGDDVKVPDEIDVQRAREILEAIRQKLGDNLSPELERRYLERLLDIQ